MDLSNALSKFLADEQYLKKKVPVACLSSDSVGKLMCMRDAVTPAGRWRVTKATNDDLTKIPAVGILIEKYTATTGLMQISGEYDGFTGLDVTKQCFVGTNGGLTQIMPSGNIVAVQYFGYAVSDTALWLPGNIGPTIIRRQ